MVAFRWSRRRTTEEPSAAAGEGRSALEARLDEELRDLD
jgi:hypothetical protein